ncbi:MAG TPA: hypothetical protein ENN36_01225 [Candidatus Bathyarchaeota archaeon]|nr:hypothetical protein [Candidatus Bathyarchaeota archaeon]
MNRKIVLPLVFVLVVMFFSGVNFVSAEGSVGVVVGQTADYTYALSRTVRDSNGNLTESTSFTVDYLETITIQTISGTNVTFRFERDLLNGTTETGTAWVDVSNGNGTGFFIVVSANRNAGALLYPDWVNENGTSEGAPSFNETVLMKCGDAMMEVNHLNLSYTLDGQPRSENYYWEKSTGLIVKWTMSGSETKDGTTETVIVHFQRVGLEHVLYPYIDIDAYPVTVNSNSAILGFEFNQPEKQIRLDVTGKTGTYGFCEITFPDGLLWGTFSLSMDGYALVEGDDYTQTHDGTYYTFSISYIHSSHFIEIVASDVVPEFSAWAILPLFMAATLLAVMLYRKRLCRPTAL